MSKHNDKIRRHRHDAILDAAASCFARTGFDGTGMAAIATAANLSIGGVYRHFPSKEAIVAALVERDLDQQLARLNEAAHATVTMTAAERVHAVVRAVLAAQIPDQATAALSIEFCAAATRDEHLARLLAAHAADVSETIGSILPGSDTEAATELLVILLDGLMLRVALATESIYSLDEAAGEIAELIGLVLNDAR